MKRVAERKPVVAYIRGLGASGGYYLGCAASKIVALPTALVGSIGVIYLRPVLEQLLGKAGVDFRVQGGPAKGHDRVLARPNRRRGREIPGADQRDLR